jgi:hypothetical protein
MIQIRFSNFVCFLAGWLAGWIVLGFSYLAARAVVASKRLKKLEEKYRD